MFTFDASSLSPKESGATATTTVEKQKSPAEKVISKVLGRHVQRLATIAHGDGVCTTCIPSTSHERVTS